MPGDVHRRTGIWVGALFGATLLVGCTDRSVSAAEVAARWSAGQHRMDVLQADLRRLADPATGSRHSDRVGQVSPAATALSRAQTRSDELLAAIEDRTPVA